MPPELDRTLDSLEELAEVAEWKGGHALSFPLDEFHALTDRLRRDLPRVITQADEVAARAEQTLEEARHAADAALNEARAETERLVAAAHKRAAALVLQSPEVQFANAQMRDITAQAQQAALNARQDADAYARETLHRLEEYVEKVQNQIRSGLVALDRASKG